MPIEITINPLGQELKNNHEIAKKKHLKKIDM